MLTITKSKEQKRSRAFTYVSLVLQKLIFLNFSQKYFVLDQTYSFKIRKLLTIIINAETLCAAVFLETL